LVQKKSQTEKTIQEIRDRIYLLQGLASSMTLDEAYRRAKKVADKVNIRPAFLMAVLKKESDWGSNVGGGNWKKDMNPKDWDAFKIITEKLNLNPDFVPVSAKPSYGWGGAMGPAQFLPRTWLQYESQIAAITGNNPPSPWDLDDAFAAAAIKLSNNGASAKTWDAEWRAAQIYFAGSNWNKPQYSFYGDAVMELAQVITEEVQKLGLAVNLLTNDMLL
jgi:membrane-bound lytic murein transglycosylase B